MYVITMQPTYEEIDRRHLQCLDEFEKLARKTFARYERVRGSGSSLLEHTRCELATRFYRNTKADVLLWLDTDMTFAEPGQIVQLCIEAHQRSAVVGAGSLVKKPMGHVNVRFGSEVKRAHFFRHGAVIAVKAIGTGVCAVSRAAFDRIEPHVRTCKNEHGEPVLTFYRSLIINGQWWGEDTSFCYLAEQAGVPVLLDTRVRVGHRGRYEYHLEDAGTQIELKEALTMNLEPKPDREQPTAPPLAAPPEGNVALDTNPVATQLPSPSQNAGDRTNAMPSSVRTDAYPPPRSYHGPGAKYGVPTPPMGRDRSTLSTGERRDRPTPSTGKRPTEAPTARGS